MPKPIKIIELDCAPGLPRPSDLIEGVIAGTILKKHLTDPVCQFFGNWTYAFENVSDEDWREAQKKTKPRIEALYLEGRIRYGSW